MSLLHKSIQSYFKVTSAVFPSLAARNAFKLFQKVRIKKRRKREEDFYAKAKEVKFPQSNFDYQVFELGNPSGKKVFMVHGWDSNVGCLSKIIFELVEQGFFVIGVNLPSHHNTKSTHTNLFECKMAVQEVLSHYKLTEPVDFVTHSFGSAVSTYALSEVDVEINKMVFLTSPNNIEDIFLQFKRVIRLGDNAYQKMLVKADNVLKESLANLKVEDKLKMVNYQNLLLIHDVNDKVLPYADSENIKKTDSRISIIKHENIGHYRMLWNEDVLNQTISYLVD